jgi:hypothetical protein
MPFQNFKLLNKDGTFPHFFTLGMYLMKLPLHVLHLFAETGVTSLLLWYADHFIELPPKDFHLPVVICTKFSFLVSVSTGLTLKSTISTNDNTPSLSAVG